MPNWVYNELTIEGNPESVTKLVNQVNQPFTRIHKNWNIETNQMEDQLTNYTNPIFAFWNITKPTDLDAYNKQRDHSLSLDEAMKFNGNDWYDFNVRNWGTKWDVAVSNGNEYSDTSIEGPVPNGENLVVSYRFNTAWSVPDVALTTLSSQYPDLLLTLNYEEETGWGGEAEFLNGELISDNSWDWMCYECDYKVIQDEESLYCDQCQEDVCPNCNFRADEECQTHGVKSEAGV